MSTAVDNVVAIYVLKMLVTPFTSTKAFKLGIIDARGKNLIPSDKFTKPEQHDAYNYLTRFVFNLKKMLARLPGGDNMLKSFVAAMLLIKENKNDSDQVNEFKLNKIMNMLNEDVVFVEETLLAQKLIKEEFASAGGVVPTTFGGGSGSLGTSVSSSGPPTNKIGPTGSQVGLDQPTQKAVNRLMARRKKPQPEEMLPV